MRGQPSALIYGATAFAMKTLEKAVTGSIMDSKSSKKKSFDDDRHPATHASGSASPRDKGSMRRVGDQCGQRDSVAEAQHLSAPEQLGTRADAAEHGGFH